MTFFVRAGLKWVEAEFWLYWAIVRAKWALAESESPQGESSGTAFRSPCPAGSRPSGCAARRVAGRPSAVHFAPSGLRAENSQRGQGEFPQKQDKAGMGLRWWLGAFCVLVLWTAWDRDTVAEKNINAFELCELKLMEPTGLSLLANGWHKSKPGKCSEHGGKKAPCSLGFCKGCPCGTDGCGEKHGFGRGLTGKQAVQKGAEPEKVLPFRDGVPQEGMYAERAEDEFRAAPSAGCDAETLGNVLGLEFRLRQPVPESKIFNGRLVLIGLPFQWHSLTACCCFFCWFLD